MKRVGIDIDGILANFSAGFVKVLNENFNVNLPSSFEPTDWGWGNAKLPAGVFSGAWQQIKSTHDFWYTLNPLPCVSTLEKYFKECADKSLEFYFITSRIETAGASARVQSESWLYEVLGNPDQTLNVLVVKDFLDKVDIVRALHIEAFIDDYAPTVIAMRSIKSCNSYLYSQPWNIKEAAAYNIKSVDSLASFFECEM